MKRLRPLTSYAEFRLKNVAAFGSAWTQKAISSAMGKRGAGSEMRGHGGVTGSNE